MKMELAELYKDRERLQGSPTAEPTEESPQQVCADEDIQAVVPSASPPSDSQSLSSTSVLGSSEVCHSHTGHTYSTCYSSRLLSLG